MGINLEAKGVRMEIQLHLTKARDFGGVFNMVSEEIPSLATTAL